MNAILKVKIKKGDNKFPVRKNEIIGIKTVIEVIQTGSISDKRSTSSLRRHFEKKIPRVRLLLVLKKIRNEL